MWVFRLCRPVQAVGFLQQLDAGADVLTDRAVEPGGVAGCPGSIRVLAGVVEDAVDLLGALVEVDGNVAQQVGQFPAASRFMDTRDITRSVRQPGRTTAALRDEAIAAARRRVWFLPWQGLVVGEWAEGPEVLGEFAGGWQVAVDRGQCHEELACLLEVRLDPCTVDLQRSSGQLDGFLGLVLADQAGRQGDLGLGVVGGATGTGAAEFRSR
jgi:hypothetical protein